MRIFGLIAASILGIVAVGATPIAAQAASECTITITQADADASTTKTFTGTSSGDFICVYANNVIVDALAGDDTVINFGDDNAINLGDGADTLDATEGCSVTAFGGSGNDTITGTACDDALSGEDGDDYLMGESGVDTLNGGDGPDALIGGIGIDSILGADVVDFCDYESGEIQTTCRYDDEAPTVSDVTFSQASVDVRSQDATLMVHLRYRDDLGVSSNGSGMVTCNPPPTASTNPGPGLFSMASGFFYSPTGSDPNNLAFGRTIVTNNRDFSVDIPIQISKKRLAGIYSCSVSVMDVLHHTASRFLGSFELVSANTSQNISDLQISALPTSSREVEVGRSAAQAMLKYRLKSSEGVASYGQLSAHCQPTAGGTLVSGLGFVIKQDGSAVTTWSNNGLSASSVGTNNDLTVTIPIQFRQGLKAGGYLCRLNGQSLPISTPALAIRVNRSGTGFDDDAPKLSNAQFSSKKLEVGSTPDETVLSFEAQDQTAIQSINVHCSLAQTTPGHFEIYKSVAFSPDGLLYPVTDSQFRYEGDRKTARIQLTLSFRVGTLPGLYRCSAMTNDSLGNQTIYPEIDLGEIQVFRTPVAQPSPPAGLNFLAEGPTKGTLSWTASDDFINPARAYVAQYSTDGAVWQDYIGGGATSATSLPISGLLGSKDYWIRVRSDNGGIPSSDLKYTPFMDLNWTTIKIRTSAPVKPATPTGLGVKASKGYVTLRWTAPADNGGSVVRDYIVEYSKNGKSSWFKVSHARSNSTTIKISKLRSKTSYSFRVRAVTNSGTSGVSKTLRVKTK